MYNLLFWWCYKKNRCFFKGSHSKDKRRLLLNPKISFIELKEKENQ